MEVSSRGGGVAVEMDENQRLRRARRSSIDPAVRKSPRHLAPHDRNRREHSCGLAARRDRNATHPSVSLDEAEDRFRHLTTLQRAQNQRKGRVDGQGGTLTPATRSRDARFLGKRSRGPAEDVGWAGARVRVNAIASSPKTASAIDEVTTSASPHAAERTWRCLWRHLDRAVVVADARMRLRRRGRPRPAFMGIAHVARPVSCALIGPVPAWSGAPARCAMALRGVVCGPGALTAAAQH